MPPTARVEIEQNEGLKGKEANLDVGTLHYTLGCNQRQNCVIFYVTSITNISGLFVPRTPVLVDPDTQEMFAIGFKMQNSLEKPDPVEKP